MNTRKMNLREEIWDIEGKFTISRGSKSVAETVVIELHENEFSGRGECVPYGRYGETSEATVALIENLRPTIEDSSLSRNDLQSLLPAGAARNALDCALWDLESKTKGIPVWKLTGLPKPRPITTAFTISLGTPAEMGNAARDHRTRPLLKLKLDGDNVIARVEAVRDAAPTSTIIVDANESWTPTMIAEFDCPLARLGVKLIEQPLPADSDCLLYDLDPMVPICADESAHESSTLPEVAERYDFVNVKLDKTGGLTEAIRMIHTAKQLGIGIMVGCMVGTSLSMAPAMLLGSLATYIDLDGPLLLTKDRNPSILYEQSDMHLPPRELWG